MNFDYSKWVLIPVLVFIAMLINVTFATLKIIYVSKGRKYLAPVIAFFEVLVWLAAIGEIMKNLNNIIYYFSFASGFSIGHYIGITIENKLAIGTLAVRIITRKDASDLIRFLDENGFGVTFLDANGTKGKVNIVFTVIKRKSLNSLLNIVNRFNPRAFISVKEVVKANEAIFPEDSKTSLPLNLDYFRKLFKVRGF